MEDKVILMHQIPFVNQYLNKGFSLGAICQELQMSPKTVTAYTNWLNKQALALEVLQQLPDAVRYCLCADKSSQKIAADSS